MFQCPRGHFCFSDMVDGQNRQRPEICFQCPRGHFCFSDSIYRRVVFQSQPSFNAREGIFAFRTQVPRVGPIKTAFRVSMPARAFLLFGRARLNPLRSAMQSVSMPARAFLLFGQSARRDALRLPRCCFNAREGIFAFRTNLVAAPQRSMRGGFQCPRGHFCFSDEFAISPSSTATEMSFNAREGIFAFRTMEQYEKAQRDRWCFNAREGIFAFRTKKWARVYRKFEKFQCPRGHFCFSDSALAGGEAAHTDRFQCPRGHFCFSDAVTEAKGGTEVEEVSMPARAFLLFGRTRFRKEAKMKRLFQCPRGHFCFSDVQDFGGTVAGNPFQCPRGHFCFSDARRGKRWKRRWVSMPARAFLLFGRPRTRRGSDTPFVGFNAREGIFAFRTVDPAHRGLGAMKLFQCPRGHFCFSDTFPGFLGGSTVFIRFNAREGIFAFRTRVIKRASCSRKRASFNAREGIFAARCAVPCAPCADAQCLCGTRQRDCGNDAAL